MDGRKADAGLGQLRLMMSYGRCRFHERRYDQMHLRIFVGGPLRRLHCVDGRLYVWALS